MIAGVTENDLLKGVDLTAGRNEVEARKKVRESIVYADLL